LGPDSLVPALKLSALAGLPLNAEEGFVLSRVDGRLTVAEICLLVPFDAEVTATILAQLCRLGALDIPGSHAAAAPTQPPSAAPPSPPPSVARATVDGLDLTAEQARRIDELFTTLDARDAFELLEIGRTDDKKEIKRAYFKMSKELHPDRFFGKNIGPYRERLSKIFQTIKLAYELLSDDDRRTAYLESIPK
jgi:hypothetical protein